MPLGKKSPRGECGEKKTRRKSYNAAGEGHPAPVGKDRGRLKRRSRNGPNHQQQTGQQQGGRKWFADEPRAWGLVFVGGGWGWGVFGWVGGSLVGAEDSRETKKRECA